ncbi:intraflagellar transport protein 46 homolog [Leptopilina heterotoma]|uniref:intraflagellar transport protein 46 homolog n=1 Tax=Leptopilina heterotoma TaxID=63436 RepID=UPI001CA9F90A|nr:intraflagellar transport protein 46 homolog [Leptopilina heterotoma]
MNFRDSSEEEDTHNISAFTKFDEANEIRNSDEAKSPISRRPSAKRRNSRNFSGDTPAHDLISPKGKNNFNKRNSEQDFNFSKPVNVGSDLSDTDETDEDDIQASNAKIIEIYDPKQFEHLQVSSEIRELFQNIQRYVPQKIDLNYKLIPFIPDYIPAVGDIDAFIKIPRPDGVSDKVGLVVLDEPCTNQSDPAVLHLQLRSQSKSATQVKYSVVKRVENAEKNGKSIDKWIEDMGALHSRKHPLTINLTRKFPDIDTLLQQWPSEVEEKLNDTPIDISKLDCDISTLVDLVCNLVDIPVYDDARLESLHTLFSLYLEVRNLKDQRF